MNAPQLLHRSSAMGQYGRPSQQQLGFLSNVWTNVFILCNLRSTGITQTMTTSARAQQMMSTLKMKEKLKCAEMQMAVHT